MGFRPTEKNLKRAGCNYWNDVDIVRWPYLGAFLEAHGGDEVHLFTGAASRTYAEVAYGPDAFLLFGRESRVLDADLIERFADECVRIPMIEESRSLNLSNSAAIAVYEGLRQNKFEGLHESGNLHRLHW